LHFERLLLSLVTVDRRTQVRLIWRGIEKGVGAYMRSEFLQSLLAGFLLWLGYRLMGLDYPVLLAVVGALAWLIPWFGAVIAMIPPLIVGLDSGLALGITAAGYTLLVLVVQEYIIEPKIFRRNSYSSLVLVLTILVLADAFGLVGLILAPLVSATIQNIFKYLIRTPDTPGPTINESELSNNPTAALRERLKEMQAGIEGGLHTSSPSIVSLTGRLNELISETETYFAGHPENGRNSSDKSR
jgi:predicted PurR-regulated permease PerM